MLPWHQRQVIFSNSTIHLRHHGNIALGQCFLVGHSYNNNVCLLADGGSHLLSLECELYEDLLQLLVDVVDAELLKAVLLEDLKAVDVQDADGDFLRPLGHRFVDRL